MFKEYFFALSADDRKELADKAGTSVGMLTQVAYGNKSIELGFADVLCALSGDRVALNDLPLTDRARQQNETRTKVVA